MKIRIDLEIEIQGDYDIEDVEDYFECQFGSGFTTTDNPLTEANWELLI